MAARVHCDKIKFWADNKDCKVWVKRHDGSFVRTNHPNWTMGCEYVITNSELEENLFQSWLDGATIELKTIHSKWVEKLSCSILDFQQYEYRIKVEKTAYDLAKEEADEQKESGQPIDIYKWHYGNDKSFTGKGLWEFSIWKELLISSGTDVRLNYFSTHVYKKIK